MTEEAKQEKKANLVYAALLLHSAGKAITEESINKIVGACDIKIDEAQVKALVAALQGVNIEDAIKSAVAMPAAAAPASGATPGATTAEEKEDDEDKEKKAEEAAEGLGSLFG